MADNAVPANRERLEHAEETKKPWKPPELTVWSFEITRGTKAINDDGGGGGYATSL
jgi:hypothetical protein